MTRATRAAVHEAIAPVVASSGLHLEDVTITGGQRSLVRVVVDLAEGSGGVDSDLLEDVSGRISTTLDDLDPINGHYTLEITTPGLDRPLREPRHFRRAQGHLLDVRTAAHRLRGRLVRVEDTHITLATNSGEQDVALGDIATATIEPELGRSNS